MRNVPWILLPDTQMSNRLRKLTIYGQSLHNSFCDDLTLPVLEILCLRNFPHYASKRGLPALPRLHTVQVINSYMGLDLRNYLRPQEKYPSLHTFELYSNEFGAQHGTFKTLESWPALSRLHLIGDEELMMFSQLLTAGIGIRVSHLVIGILFEPSILLAKWIFPQDLRSLTVFVGSQSVETFATIRECLIFNTRFMASGSFKSLLMYVSPGHPHDLSGSRLQEAVHEIRDLSLHHGVHFECKNVGMSSNPYHLDDGSQCRRYWRMGNRVAL